MSATWAEFKAARPELAEAGRALFYQFGLGEGFLATVRPDGGPRLHPMCPIIDGQGLYALIVPSLKRKDLVRDGRYAMHSHPVPDNEDAFYITGRARLIEDREIRQRLVDQFVSERGNLDPVLVADELLFEFLIESALQTKTTGHGDWNPQHTVWRADSSD